MTRKELLEAVAEILRDIFDDDTLEVTESTCSDDVEDWDSLEQINILVAIQDRFGIQFSLDDVSDLKDVGDTLDLIERKLHEAE
ncbi:MAG: acyl carrier protein [Oscillospiraceae bacterium]|nr:acyl carrier protein [Oscillospiraceae bacterium]